MEFVNRFLSTRPSLTMVEIDVCSSCGSIVFDKKAHESWHNKIMYKDDWDGNEY